MRPKYHYQQQENTNNDRPTYSPPAMPPTLIGGRDERCDADNTAHCITLWLIPVVVFVFTNLIIQSYAAAILPTAVPGQLPLLRLKATYTKPLSTLAEVTMQTWQTRSTRPCRGGHYEETSLGAKSTIRRLGRNKTMSSHHLNCLRTAPISQSRFSPGDLSR